ncbi:50S ribosome-binding GTPase [Solwaraspora sp. WMMD791]|uniref:GTPase n=1 Tax=Solwaraspora sp. WMMD791 TaxID=3016086 RepID=UPI00249AC033|nr:GTPase [Solwaraspora sp. WMMD791]WFE29285.1 50S ribosome-binding GTPase [Solwaraspora sp. WMMD791]
MTSVPYASDEAAPLCARTAAQLRWAVELLPDGPLRTDVEAVTRRLADRTIRVAVGGRLNAGKSTLVNALLGQRLAASGATERTTVNVWFRYHPLPGVTVHLVDGTSTLVAAGPGGGVPVDLPVDHRQVSHLTVRTPDRRIDREFVLIDTPGSDSPTHLDDYAMAAVRQADVLLYVMHSPGEVDRQALEEFQATVTGAGLPARNVLGVLSRMDAVSDDRPPDQRRADAHRLAARAAQRLAGLVAEVLPVAGLVAQTARGVDFTERHATALRGLAGLDEPARARLLDVDDQRFLGRLGQLPIPVPVEDCRELLDLLGRFGIREALSVLDSGVADTPDLLAVLAHRCGIEQVVGTLRDRFISVADPLRAHSALEQVRAALARTPVSVADGPGRQALRETFARLAREPELRRVALADVLQAHVRGDLVLPEDASGHLRDLVSGRTTVERFGLAADTPAELRDRLRELTRRWRSLESRTPRAHRRLVTDVREVLELSYFAEAGAAAELAVAVDAGAARPPETPHGAESSNRSATGRKAPRCAEEPTIR